MSEVASAKNSSHIDTDLDANGVESLRQQASILIERLERISADSIWAHRSSGIRGSLLKSVDEWDFRGDAPGKETNSQMMVKISSLVKAGFQMLENAARDY